MYAVAPHLQNCCLKSDGDTCVLEILTIGNLSSLVVDNGSYCGIGYI